VAASEIDRRLREAGSKFITSHDEAEAAIREAVRNEMAPETISRVSGLSPETVAAFLRHIGDTPERK
jgi:hypothetical protein